MPPRRDPTRIAPSTTATNHIDPNRPLVGALRHAQPSSDSSAGGGGTQVPSDVQRAPSTQSPCDSHWGRQRPVFWSQRYGAQSSVPSGPLRV